MEYTAGRGTTALGIVGTVLGSIGTAGVLGGGNLLGMNANTNCGCMHGENAPVNRYEVGLQQENSELRSQIALRDASIYTDGKLNDLRNYVDGKFACVNNELRDIAVYQASNTATVSCLAQQVAGIQGVLGQITKTVVPNSAVCPGWGNVTITPAAAPTTGA
jgi:hypothetical protein